MSKTEVTSKMNIKRSAKEVFEAIVDPNKIGNFWFTSSSERWEQGKQITLTYAEYEAVGTINVQEIKQDEKIVYTWGQEQGEVTVVTITFQKLEDNSTTIEVTESGWKAEDKELFNKMLGQKEGWVYTLSCLKAYLEHGVSDLRASLVH
ncbi:SRPBCC family protein [Ornithinibacillus halotolerans]|uniref:ATPase n=1 Tax=Ornithinibacillus halotolerans TaxID=1274357 RepID=A0A916S620_9BACI|nr:SRPBCC family protein [Ornithinibacillus halotolerans]GGA85138.1 ATPase [Ornithinibacillus halotolerans]